MINGVRHSRRILFSIAVALTVGVVCLAAIRWFNLQARFDLGGTVYMLREDGRLNILRPDSSQLERDYGFPLATFWLGTAATIVAGLFWLAALDAGRRKLPPGARGFPLD